MDIGIFYPGSQAIKKAIDETEYTGGVGSPTSNQITVSLNKMVALTHRSHKIGIAQGAILSFIGAIFVSFFFRWVDTQSIYA